MRDPEKQRAAKKRWYENNRQVYRDRNKRKYEERRAYVQEVKNVPCTDCGMRYPYYVMHFDHLRDKLFNIGTALSQLSLKKIIEEIEKCEVVCANCHAERTHARRMGLV